MPQQSALAAAVSTDAGLLPCADNFHQDCLNNPRSTMSQEDQATFMQLVPPTLVAACPAPDSGTALPVPPGGGH